ncbi:MAG: DNA primase [Pirellulaceae bacterium]
MSYSDAKEQVRQATDIVDLVGRSVALRRQGRQFVGLCPWHPDRKPSLTVNPDRQTWKCWVCDIGGDAYSFVMKQEGCDFREALTMLAERAGIELSNQPRRKAEPGSPDDKNALYQCCEWAARQFHEYLLRSEQAEAARNYVEDRAITPVSVERFLVGYAPQDNTWLLNRARNTPFAPAVLEAAGLLSKYEDSGTYRDFFRGRVMFPIRDTQARPVAFGGRILPQLATDKTGKYINSRETRLYTKSDTLYALDLAKNHISKSRQLTVVEGYTDVILCHQHGVNDVVACCGTALTERHIRILKRFADTIYLVLDGDDAGQRRTNEVLELFVAAQVDLRVMTLPDELDPAEFMIERGGDAFRDLLATATDALEHKIRTATRGIDLARDTHRASQALEEILKTIVRGLPADAIDASSLRAQQLLARLARQFQLDDGDVRTRFAQLRRGVKSRAAETPEAPAEPTYKLAALSIGECELLETLGLHPELVAVALAEVADDDLSSEPAREIFSAYRRLEEAGQSLDFQAVLAEIENVSLKNLLVALDETAQEKSAKAILDGPTRLRSVIRQFHQQHQQRELRQRALIHEDKEVGDEVKQNLWLEEIAAKRRQQGLTAPLEG